MKKTLLIAQRKQARSAQGPVPVLCGGAYSMGTPFGAATRETGGELSVIPIDERAAEVRAIEIG